MRLTRLNISGFKSFAKPTELTFDGWSIIGIIGPNGSGKSNIAEAIRWVLGEQSRKSLRSTTAKDIIFSSRDGKGTSLRRAHVALTFNNESNRFPDAVKQPEVTIKREQLSSGESEYTVNEIPTRLHDLKLNLAQAGIGVKSYAVISQGQVDEYIKASPSDRRHLFDEACGVKPLQIKQVKAKQALAKAEEHIQSLQVDLAEAKAPLAVLARQVKEFDKHRALEEEYNSTQKNWLASHWHHLTGKITELQADVAAKQKTAHAHRAARQVAEKTLLRQVAENSDDQHNLELGRQYNERQREREDLARSIQEAQAGLRRAVKEIESARKEELNQATIADIKSLLERCHTALTTERSSSHEDLAREIQSVITADIITSNEALEAALAAHTRFATLSTEYRDRLRLLPALPEPPTVNSDTVDQSFLENSLEVARESEIKSANSLSLAESALSETARELAAHGQEILREQGSQFMSDVQSGKITPDTSPSHSDVMSLHGQLQSLATPDPLIIKQYQEQKGRTEDLEQQLQDVIIAKTNAEKLVLNLERDIETRFHQQFEIIKTKFVEHFSQLFGGGQADLWLNEEGVHITAAPPGKAKRHIDLLSGGEKTLTALALLFAIIKAQQPPFIVLDEVDAALDEANASKFANALNELSKHTQTLVVTHNRYTMQAAQVLYGVTMGPDAASQVYSLAISKETGYNPSYA